MTVQDCVITHIQYENSTALSMRLHAPGMAQQARPGNFVHVLCGDGLYLRRPVSICDVHCDEIRVVFDVRGKGTAYLAHRRAGDSLNILGPLGNAFPTEEAAGRILLIGGGIGVPPLLFCARELQEKAEPAPCDAVLGFRHGDAAMLEEDFLPLCGEVLVATDDGSCGFHGHAPACAEQLLAKHRYAAVYACGPRPLLRAVQALCTAHQISGYLSLEERMGCGVGACLVCACKMRADNPDGYTYRHVCRDGPVFDAREVLFT